MGGDSSKIDYDKIEQFKKLVSEHGDYKRITHQFFGDIKVGVNKMQSQEMIMLKELWFHSIQEAEKFQNLLVSRQLSHNFLAKPIAYCTVVEDNMCSSIIRYKFACKCTELTLADVIRQKVQHSQHTENLGSKEKAQAQEYDGDEYFSEPEIWYILDGLVHMIKQFRNLGFVHGFIQPETLYVDQEGHLLLPDVILFLTPNESYEQSNGKVDIFTYEKIKAAVSPEIMRAIKKNKPLDYDTSASEIWSICLTVLCVCVNCDLSYFYDWNRKRVNMKRIKEKFQYMSEINYSDQLIQILSNGLEKKPADRMTIDAFYKFLMELDSNVLDHEHSVQNSVESHRQERESAVTKHSNELKYNYDMPAHVPSHQPQPAPHYSSFGPNHGTQTHNSQAEVYKAAPEYYQNKAPTTTQTNTYTYTYKPSFSTSGEHQASHHSQTAPIKPTPENYYKYEPKIENNYSNHNNYQPSSHYSPYGYEDYNKLLNMVDKQLQESRNLSKQN